MIYLTTQKSKARCDRGQSLWDKKIVNSQHCVSGYDMYDFSEVTSDLAILRSQLFTLNVGEKPKPNNHVTATWDPQWDIFTHF